MRLNQSTYPTAYEPPRYWLFGLTAIGLALLAGYLTATMGVPGAVLSVLLPSLLALVVGVLLNPKFGVFIYIQLSYLLPLIGHFVALELPIPMGTLIEGILLLTLLGIFLNGRQMAWHRLRRPAFLLVVLWVVFTGLEFFNPEMPNRITWLIRFRTLSFQWLCVGVIISVIDISLRDVKVLIASWLFWSVGAALWAFRQQYIGLTDSETQWLMTVGYKNHLLFGRLRSFSFYSDAAQLGVEMAGATLVCLILSIETKKIMARLGFLLLTGLFFWGFAVTGTRSALFVIFGGVPFYLLIKGNIRQILIGGLIGAFILAFLLFTSIGSSNYHVYRLRTALHPTEDASFMLRLQNQQILRGYLAPLPFGVGLGTSSASGGEYNPDHWAGIIQPDTAYVIVWMETGIVGLTLYITILLAFVGLGAHKIWYLRNKQARLLMIALMAQFVGILLMAYSNTIMGQFPTSTLLFITTFLVTTCDRWDPPAPVGVSKKTTTHSLAAH